MRGGERHAQAAADQHHHHMRGARALGQVLGVAGEVDARVVDHAFLDRRGHHRVVFAAQATVDRAVQHLEHVAAVGGVEPAGHAGSAQRNVLDLDAGQQRAVADHRQARVEVFARCARAQLGPHPGGLAGSQRDDRAPYRSSRRSST